MADREDTAPASGAVEDTAPGVWVCETCGQHYDDEGSAADCEAIHDEDDGRKWPS